MSLRQRVRYRFDNLMSRGVLAQIALLAIFTVVLIVITATLLVVFDLGNMQDADGSDSFSMLVFKALEHTLDPGTIGNDTNTSWPFLFVMLFATLGGLLVVSALIGVINQAFGSLIENLRRGRSVVIERDHTVILGWTPKIFTLLHELVEASSNHRGACVVILADRDKVEMDADVIAAIRHPKLRVVTRSGSPMMTADLCMVSLATSKAVIVLAPEVHGDGTPMEAHESDTVVLKTLLALAKHSPNAELHVVAEIFDVKTETVARMVAGKQASLILASPLISRLLVQTGRQSGLSVVYTELLDFEGSEIYVRPEPALTGKSFRDAIAKYDTSSLIGVETAAGETLLPPPFDRKFEPGDSVIAISSDDDTVLLDGTPIAFGETELPAELPPHQKGPERTLVLGGTDARLTAVLTELDTYVSAGSEVLVVSEAPHEPPPLKHIRVTARVGDLTDRRVLDSLAVTDFDHVLVLSETAGRTQEMADARTTVTLLHLRDLERIADKKVPITSEILDILNRDLASVSEADDFIVSNTLISLLVSQVAENPHLVRVFDLLFSAEGSEIYLRPATEYVQPGEHQYGVVCEAALRRGEIAIGYRHAKLANDSEQGYGVAINPSKRRKVTLGAGDKVIVLADS